LSGIITYFSNTYFYSFIASIFTDKEITTNQKISLRDRPLIEGFSDETTRSQNKSKGNSKISEWLNPEPEVKEESNNKKYYIIAGMLIACITWYYWGEISPVLYNWFRRPRSGNDGTGGNNPGMDRGNIQPSLDNKPTIEDRLKNLVNSNKSDQSQIQLVDNTQNIASSSKVKLDNTQNVDSKLDNSPPSDNSMNQYFTKPVEQQMTGLRDITGQDLTAETNSVVNEIDQFLNYYDNASFPKNAVVGAGIYKLLRDRLQKLIDVTGFYGEISDDEKVMDKLDRFTELEDQFITQHNSPEVESSNLDNQTNTNNQNIMDNQSDTYEEVAVANIESRMAWSDRATPSVHSQDINSQIGSPSVHSEALSPNTPQNEANNLDSQPDINEQSTKPKYTFANLLDSIKARREDSHVVGSPSNKISNLVDNADNLDDKDLMSSVKETFKEDIGLKVDTSDVNQQAFPQDLPKIEVDSSNSSMEQYFPKPDVTQQELSSRLSKLFGQITNRRDDSNVVGSPNVSQLGLQPEPSRLSPLNTKPSLSNLLDDTVALFEDDDDDLVISNIDKGKGKEIPVDVINDWDKVETNIHMGDSPTNISVDLKYDNLWTRIASYRFIMNTGQVIDYPFVSSGNIQSRSFDLSSRIETDNNSIIELKEVIILDLNYQGNSVWKNTKYF